MVRLTHFLAGKGVRRTIDIVLQTAGDVIQNSTELLRAKLSQARKGARRAIYFVPRTVERVIADASTFLKTIIFQTKIGANRPCIRKLCSGQRKRVVVNTARFFKTI